MYIASLLVFLKLSLTFADLEENHHDPQKLKELSDLQIVTDNDKHAIKKRAQEFGKGGSSTLSPDVSNRAEFIWNMLKSKKPLLFTTKNKPAVQPIQKKPTQNFKNNVKRGNSTLDLDVSSRAEFIWNMLKSKKPLLFTKRNERTTPLTQKKSSQNFKQNVKGRKSALDYRVSHRAQLINLLKTKGPLRFTKQNKRATQMTQKKQKDKRGNTTLEATYKAELFWNMLKSKRPHLFKDDPETKQEPEVNTDLPPGISLSPKEEKEYLKFIKKKLIEIEGQELNNQLTTTKRTKGGLQRVGEMDRSGENIRSDMRRVQKSMITWQLDEIHRILYSFNWSIGRPERHPWIGYNPNFMFFWRRWNYYRYFRRYMLGFHAGNAHRLKNTFEEEAGIFLYEMDLMTGREQTDRLTYLKQLRYKYERYAIAAWRIHTREW